MKNINITFTFTDDEVRSIQECILEEMIEQPLLTAVFGQIVTGVKNGKEIGFIKSDMGLMLKSGAMGCGGAKDSTYSSISTSKKKWDLKPVHFYNEECENDTRNTFLDLAKNGGIDVYDMTGSEYYALLQSLLAKNLAKNVYVLAWFADTATLNQTDGGKLKDGVDIKYFNPFDGLFKQLTAIYTANAARRVAITANAGANYAAQDAITDAQCTAVFNDLLRKADPRLANASDKIYISTRSLVQGYRWDMQAKGTDTLMTKQIEGVEVPTANGIPIIESGVWDEIIRAYFNDGTKYDSPHRAILTTKSQLALAFQSNGAMEDLDLFYDKYHAINVVRGEDQIDAKALEDHMFQIAI